MCYLHPAGSEIVELIASLKWWIYHKAEVKYASLQTGDAARDVYVQPWGESMMKIAYFWLLLTVAYGLVNTDIR